MTKKSNQEFQSVINQLKLLREKNLSVDSELISVIDKLIKFEYLIADISTKLSNIKNSQFDSEIENALWLIIEFLQLDRSSLFEISKDKKQFISIYSVAHNELNPIKTKIGAKLFPWSFANMIAGKTLSFASHKELPHKAIHDAKRFLKINLLAGFLVPIVVNKEVKYALAGGLKKNLSEKWPENLFPRIQMLGEIIANTIEKKNYEIQLKESILLQNKLTKELEFENFYLQKRQDLNDKFIQNPNDHKYDKSMLWISKGIENYAKNGNLKLNSISKTANLSKTSFYNIYPNNESRTGFERYKHDLILFIEYKLGIIFNEIYGLISTYSIDERQEIFAETCYQNYVYFKCLALMIIEKEDTELILAGQKIHSDFQKVIATYLKKMTNSNNRNVMKNAIINTIYHQSIVSKPKNWKISIVEIVKGF